MTKKRKPNKTYTREFKQEAVKLMEESDRPAAELGIIGVNNWGQVPIIGGRFKLYGMSWYSKYVSETS